MAYILCTYLLGRAVLPELKNSNWNWATQGVVAGLCVVFEYLLFSTRMRKLNSPFNKFIRLIFLTTAMACFAAYGVMYPTVNRIVIPESIKGNKVSIVIPAKYEKVYIVPTVKYVFENISTELLHEIIVVDDMSADPVAGLFKEAIKNDEYFSHLSIEDQSKLMILTNTEKQGLIRAKIQGGNVATGTHIFFLDGHCRMQSGAMEKLVERIQQGSYKRIVVPMVADVNGDTWKLKDNIGSKMMFTWNFEFDWFDDGTDEVPIMSGGLLLITKRWWDESGYDKGMLDWGGENIEQSLKTWQCGGEILVERKSIIGHIFERPKVPNKVGPKQVEKNQARAAFVWLDDYFEVFKKHQTVVESFKGNFGEPMDERLLERLNDNCEPFSKFMERFRDVFETQGLIVQEMHHLRDSKTGLCLTMNKKKKKDHEGTVFFEKCKPGDTGQIFGLIKEGIRLINQKHTICLDFRGVIPGSATKVIGYSCDKGKNQNQNIHFVGKFPEQKGRSRNSALATPGKLAQLPLAGADNDEKGDDVKVLTSVHDNRSCLGPEATVVKCKDGIELEWLW